MARDINQPSIRKIIENSEALNNTLKDEVIGQDTAVDKFIRGYQAALIKGKGSKEKPAATYLFAGPPGVGKSSLAKSVAKALKMPIRIFDMSEYAGNNGSIDGLIGFEKTWKDAKEGVMTSYVDKNPKSVIVIDEIEKAGNSVKMMFLQVIEGGRLTDKFTEKTVSFSDIILIFTTNCGKELYEGNYGKDLSLIPDEEVLDKLRADEAFPNELCSRFASGNIIMFNHLEPKSLLKIVDTRMSSTTKELMDTFDVNVNYDPLLPELFLFHMGAGMDARIASNKSGEFIKAEVLEFYRRMLKSGDDSVIERIDVKINLPEPTRNSLEISAREMFESSKAVKVLKITDNDLKIELSNINEIEVTSVEQMVGVLNTEKPVMAIVDLEYKMSAFNERILETQSVGMDCFNFLLNKAPQIPIYVVGKRIYERTEIEDIRRAGARNVVQSTSRRINKTGLILAEAIRKVYTENNIKIMRQKRQVINFKSSYEFNNNSGVIRIYDLKIESSDSGDAEIRMKAESSKVFDFERPKIKFEDIIGANLVKRDFNHFIKYIQNIEKYILNGGVAPKGAILYGPPGTGKTSLAKALASECNATFLSTTGADIRNANDPVKEIKELFEMARSNAPAIIFIDEFDVIGKERTGRDTYQESIVNTLLTQMEGFDDKDPLKPVFVLAATNYSVRREPGDNSSVVIDPALVRRFDNEIYVGLPDSSARKEYITMTLKKHECFKNVSEIAIDYMVEHTRGKSIAYLQKIINNLINLSIDDNRRIDDEFLTDMVETMIFGEKREESEEEILATARHETGHAYVGFRIGDMPRFISIESRGGHLGYVSFDESQGSSRDNYLNRICRALAGRAAEVVYYGDKGINAGASSDLNNATYIAIRMICVLGMGSLGFISIDPDKVLESPMCEKILAEAKVIIDEQFERAKNFITEGKQEFDRIVDILLEKTYIQGDDLITVLEGGDIDDGEGSLEITDEDIVARVSDNLDNSNIEVKAAKNNSKDDNSEIVKAQNDELKDVKNDASKTVQNTVSDNALNNTSNNAIDNTQNNTAENVSDTTSNTVAATTDNVQNNTPANTQDNNQCYVVFNGRKKGIYDTWGECLRQIYKFPNAVYKKYSTREEANKAIDGYRVGMKNIKDKKLLYHMVKVSDLVDMIKNSKVEINDIGMAEYTADTYKSLAPTKKIGGKTYMNFHFHPYSKDDSDVRKQNPNTEYAYVCVTRDYAKAVDFGILFENTGDEKENRIYKYREGIDLIDWKSLESFENDAMDVECITETDVTIAVMFSIYCSKEETAVMLEKLINENNLSDCNVHVNTNSRMFM